MTCGYTCREQMLQRESKVVVLSLDIWPSRKVLKRLLQNIYLILDLLYDKRNPLTTVADESIFKKKKKYLRLPWDENVKRYIYPGITMMEL